MEAKRGGARVLATEFMVILFSYSLHAPSLGEIDSKRPLGFGPKENFGGR